MTRKRNSLVEEIFDMLVQMPWWAGVFAAGAFWILGGVLFGRETGAGFESALSPLIRVFFNFLAILALLAALISAIKSASRRKLLDQTQGLDAIRALSWRQFEHLVGEAYRRRGYEVQETGGGGADGGIDLVLFGREGKVLVQCKRWQARQVGGEKVRELYGVVMSEQAERGILVTSGHYTKDAQAFAAGKPMDLIDGPELLKLVESVQQPSSTPADHSVAVPESAPLCPLCSSPMVLRTAKRGRNAGSQFYGCTKYPDCKGTRSA